MLPVSVGKKHSLHIGTRGLTLCEDGYCFIECVFYESDLFYPIIQGKHMHRNLLQSLKIMLTKHTETKQIRRCT